MIDDRKIYFFPNFTRTHFSRIFLRKNRQFGFWTKKPKNRTGLRQKPEKPNRGFRLGFFGQFVFAHKKTFFSVSEFGSVLDSVFEKPKTGFHPYYQRFTNLMFLSEGSKRLLASGEWSILVVDFQACCPSFSIQWEYRASSVSFQVRSTGHSEPKLSKAKQYQKHTQTTNSCLMALRQAFQLSLPWLLPRR